MQCNTAAAIAKTTGLASLGSSLHERSPLRIRTQCVCRTHRGLCGFVRSCVSVSCRVTVTYTSPESRSVQLRTGWGQSSAAPIKFTISYDRTVITCDLADVCQRSCKPPPYSALQTNSILAALSGVASKTNGDTEQLPQLRQRGLHLTLHTYNSPPQPCATYEHPGLCMRHPCRCCQQLASPGNPLLTLQPAEPLLRRGRHSRARLRRGPRPWCPCACSQGRRSRQRGGHGAPSSHGGS
jgi:hypothetical protein